MDPLSARMIVESEEASQCLVPDTRTSCLLIDDSQLKPVALEDERMPSEELPAPNARFLLGTTEASDGYWQAPTRFSKNAGAMNPSKFHIFWDKAYFATAVGALRLSIMGCMMFAFLLLSFFKGDSCHASPRSSHSETSSTTTTSSVGPTIGDNGFWVSRYVTPSPNPTPTETALTGSSLSLNVHLFICSVTFAAMLAWIAVDNSSFNYRFPFKWRLFDCCVYCKLILLSLISASVLVNTRNHSSLAEKCKSSIGKLDMAIAFSFLAVVIMLTLVTLRLFDKDAPQPTRSTAGASNRLQWIHRRFSRSRQTRILLQQVA
ncbi:uncharacterized protein LOC111245183 isoform X1 [Varroa destructor]|uniref:Uncharacterized protein n=1 Tax=Varroa destructor TaxID=109461 RepID=A0A7M7JNI1_VARDE|nr:uncharacterized protein LOC111245183 isoform X1 [Varroa destructor]XP_022648897.1 uncharacterized protein LOC111245183 isoform X1 [Varroa destructor]